MTRRAKLLSAVSLVGVALVTAVAVSCCAGAREARAPTTNVAAIASVASSSPAAPAPTEPAVRSAEILDGQRVSDAAPWKPPSAEHPRGTLLLAATKAIYEVDLESLSPVRHVELGAASYAVRLAATTSGAIATWDAGQGALRIETFDAELHRTHSLERPAVSCSGVSAERDRAAVVVQGTSGDHTLELWEISTGRVLARRSFAGGVCAPLSERAHVLLRNGRVYYVKQGHEVELRARSLDLSKSLGSFLVVTEPEPQTISNYTALRAWDDDVFFSLRQRQFRLTPDLKLVRELPASNAVPSFEPGTGRALYRDGSTAERHGQRRQILLKFESDTFNPESETPVAKNEWVAFFFWGGRAIFVSQPPSVRLTVVDVEAKRRAGPSEWAAEFDQAPYFWN